MGKERKGKERKDYFRTKLGDCRQENLRILDIYIYIYVEEGNIRP